MTVINDPVLTSYVNRVGKRLANSAEARDGDSITRSRPST
jgi:predicted Zn-dependent protease